MIAVTLADLIPLWGTTEDEVLENLTELLAEGCWELCLPDAD